MTRLKLVSTKITHELVDRLERYTQSIGSNQSAVVRKAIEHYLEEVDPVDALVDLTEKTVYPVDPVRSEIEDIKARLTALERLTQLTTVYPVREVKTLERSTRSTRSTKVKDIPMGALSTGELFEALEGKGYQKSIGTLRRALRVAIGDGRLPDDLAGLGVTADFEFRRSANPKDNSVRWLFLDHPN